MTDLLQQVWTLQSISLGTVTKCLAFKNLLCCTLVRTLLSRKHAPFKEDDRYIDMIMIYNDKHKQYKENKTQLQVYRLVLLNGAPVSDILHTLSLILPGFMLDVWLQNDIPYCAYGSSADNASAAMCVLMNIAWSSITLALNLLSLHISDIFHWCKCYPDAKGNYSVHSYKKSPFPKQSTLILLFTACD